MLIQWRKFCVILAVSLIAFPLLASAVWAKDKDDKQEVTLTIPGFQEMLVATSKTSPGEIKQLQKAAVQYFEQEDPVDTTAFKNFLKDHPQSAWRVAVQLNLGLVYYQNGAFSDAISAWENAWEAGKDADGLMAKAMVDRVFGELVRMRARLGHADIVEQKLIEVGEREFIGPATEMVSGARSGLSMMREYPEYAFLCGPASVGSILIDQYPNSGSMSLIEKARSTKHGVALSDLYDLADSIPEMDYVGVFREQYAVDIPLPAVVHWKLNHYAAILSEKNGRYHIKDPTFGGDLWVPKHVLDKEASGYFMIPRKSMASGWREVDKEEAKNIYGMGNTTVHDPNGTAPCDNKNKSQNCCCDNGENPAMPGYDVHTMLVSLNITDTPVSYSPPKGKPINITLTYNQREGDQQAANPPYFNLGNKWVFNWLSFIEENPSLPGKGQPLPGGIYASVRRAVAGGGAITYAGYDSTTGQFTAESLQGAVLVRMAAGVYERRLKDGGKEIYSHSDGASETSTFRRIFLTQIIDKSGNKVMLNYENIAQGVRLLSITDAVAKSTTITYQSGTSLKITTITDPFGRFTSVDYDGSNRLDEITDAEGMTTTFAYSTTSDFIASMTTPYTCPDASNCVPTYTFNRSTPTEEAQQTRWISVTDSDGQTERTEFRHYADNIAATQPNVPASANMGKTINNTYNHMRNTFYWDKRSYALHYADSSTRYLNAELKHWLHIVGFTNPFHTSRVLEAVEHPLENRIWYLYPGQGDTIYTGTQDQISAEGRVLSDGSTQRTLYTRNSLGKVTCKVNPENTVTKYEYATNGIDLEHIKRRTDNVSGVAAPNCGTGSYETLVAITYYPQATYGIDHLVNTRTVTLSAGVTSTTTFTYNSAGQVKTITNQAGHITEYFYDANGYLERIRDQANGVDLVSYTYYDGGIEDDASQARNLKTKTNASGFVETYSYDKLNRLKKIEYSDGSERTFNYDKLDVVTEVDRYGDTIKRGFNEVRNLTAIDYYDGTVDPDHKTFASTYDYYANGKLRYYTDGEGNITANVLDAQSRVVQVQRGDAGDFNIAADPVLNDADTNRTTYTYEAATSRLSSITDPGNAGTQYAYDKADHIKTVTDSRGIVTSFQYNAFGELARENSPDRGTILYFYDTASRLTRKEYYAYTTNASPGTLLQADIFSYDSLNRLATIDFGNNATVDRIYEYDLTDHSYSKGRLSRIRGYAANGTTLQYQMDYHYYPTGNVKEYRLTEDNVTYITTYNWDNENNLVDITYPDGAGVKYVYASGRLVDVSTKLNTHAPYQTIIGGLDYLPFGPLKYLEYANGLSLVLPRDKAYRLKDIDVSDNEAINVVDRHYAYDIFSNVDTITNNLNANRNWDFGYNSPQRLDDVKGPLLASGAYGHMALTYDGVGNRLTRSVQNSTPTTVSNETYTPVTGKNQLDTVVDSILSTTRDLDYDLRGNVNKDTQGAVVKILNYDIQSRMASVNRSGVADPLGVYVYNALGQRISKDVSVPYYRKIHYHYDLNGQLLAESNERGITLKRYIYAASQLVAVVVPDDDDNDQMSDAWENLHFGDLSHSGSADTDSDGISDIQEYFSNSNPWDADNDNLGDRWELQFAGNLSTVDNPADNPDNDYLNNEQEWQEWRNPLVFDDLLPLNGTYKGIIFHTQEMGQ